MAPDGALKILLANLLFCILVQNYVKIFVVSCQVYKHFGRIIWNKVKYNVAKFLTTIFESKNCNSWHNK